MRTSLRSVVPLIAATAAFAAGAVALFAQWPSYPTGVPKGADGKPDLTAPAPRTADGHPDLSGTWELPRAGGRGAPVAGRGGPDGGRGKGTDAAPQPPPPPTLPADGSPPGVSILSNLGLPDLIAETPEHYAAIAALLAGDWVRLSELRAGLRPRMRTSPLLDGARFAADVEAAFRGMWMTWCGR